MCINVYGVWYFVCIKVVSLYVYEGLLCVLQHVVQCVSLCLY